MSDGGHGESSQDPREHWNQRYAQRGQVWSGKVNAVLHGVAEGLPAGRALDLGCGEGGDAVWLAEQGWRVLGIDISEVAVARARAAAEGRGLGSEAVTFEAMDLADLQGQPTFDLVTASFLQSTVSLDRTGILRRAATLVDPGGRLLITAHAAPPPWADATHRAAFRAIDPVAEVADLDLAPGEWEVLVAEVRHRSAVGPDGQSAELDDSVVLLRRRIH